MWRKGVNVNLDGKAQLLNVKAQSFGEKANF